MNINIPKCPKCGKKMILRTARRGSHAGKQFYGCQSYPKCKAIVNIDDTEQVISSSFKEKIPPGFEQEVDIPSILIAREKFDNFQVRFFQTLALPFETLEDINFESKNRANFTKYSKWRLDYPINNNVNLSSEIKAILLIVQKILSRGHLTLISPNLEEKLRKFFKVSSKKLADINVEKYFSIAKTFKNSNINFDGKGTEKKFFENNLYDFFGPYYKNYVLPQVHISSLIRSKDENLSDYRRIDFLITLPDKVIIVEIDGEEHESHIERDRVRDSLLSNEGYEVIRIKNEEVSENNGANLDRLNSLIKEKNINNENNLKDYEKFLLAIKLCHQLQITIIESILAGFTDIDERTKIYFDDNSVNFNNKELSYILKQSFIDLNELITNLSKLYNQSISLDNIKLINLDDKHAKDGIIISYNENVSLNSPIFIIQDIMFPYTIAQPIRPSENIEVQNTSKQLLTYLLNYIFRFDNFLEGQYEAMERVLSGKDTLVLLPTGAGKSIVFQLASLLLPGVSIIIDPILSLIDDQIDNLQRLGFDRCIGITSLIIDPRIKEKVIESFGRGEYLLCYISPERLQTEKYRNALRNLTVTTPISLIVIDEAHCVSEWGHDFRTSYLNIGRITREYCKYQGKTPPLLALTGTASSAVLRDVQRELGISDYEAVITPKTFNRSELSFSVIGCSSAEKIDKLKGLLQRKIPEQFGITSTTFHQTNGKDTKCGILFFPHVNGSCGVVENSKIINDDVSIRTNYYSGKRPKNWGKDSFGWTTFKRTVAKDFKNNKLPLLCATKSFGMGIDKPNIRYTVHFGIPNSIESFYQEAGRAGRDRNRSECVLIVSNDYENRSTRLLSPNTSPEKINEIMEDERDWDSDDDITRAMYFHSNSFKGIESELVDIEKLLDDLGDFSRKTQKKIIANEDAKRPVEKSIYRLLTIGIVEDYTIDYSNFEFIIIVNPLNKEKVLENYSRYVSGYNKGRVAKESSKIDKLFKLNGKQFIIESCKVLLNFVYDTIEKGRRRALREMLSLAEEPLKEENIAKNTDDLIRNRILRYLESTYSEEIDEIINSDSVGGFEELKRLFDGYETVNGEIWGGLRSPMDAFEIRGQAARYLESTPDHPGLLLLRALSEIHCQNYDIDIFFQNIDAAINFAFERYEIEEIAIHKILVWIAEKIYERNIEIYEQYIFQVLNKINKIEFARLFLKKDEFHEDVIYEPSVYIFKKYSEDIINVFT